MDLERQDKGQRLSGSGKPNFAQHRAEQDTEGAFDARGRRAGTASARPWGTGKKVVGV